MGVDKEMGIKLLSSSVIKHYSTAMETDDE